MADSDFQERGKIKMEVNGAKLYDDGSVEYEGKCGKLSLKEVTSIVCTNGYHDWAFAALKKDGSVLPWGRESHGGDAKSKQSSLVDVVSIASTFYGAFAALKKDGSVVPWGHENSGGDAGSSGMWGSLTGSNQSKLVCVQFIISNGGSFAALKSNGSIIYWGSEKYTDKLKAQIDEESQKVQKDFPNPLTPFRRAFALLSSDNATLSKKRREMKGDMSKVAILLTVDKKRDGNEADVERLLPLLEECGYGEIINKREATKQDMIDTLRDLQKRDNLHSGLLVVIACHGHKNGTLFGSDNKTVKLELLQTLVTPDLCPAFSGKPKIFLVASCRGDDEMPLQLDGHANAYTNDATDYYTAYATIEGYGAWRHEDNGSLFLQAICSVWEKDFFTSSLDELMTKINVVLKNCIYCRCSLNCSTLHSIAFLI